MHACTHRSILYLPVQEECSVGLELFACVEHAGASASQHGACCVGSSSPSSVAACQIWPFHGCSVCMTLASQTWPAQPAQPAQHWMCCKLSQLSLLAYAAARCCLQWGLVRSMGFRLAHSQHSSPASAWPPTTYIDISGGTGTLPVTGICKGMHVGCWQTSFHFLVGPVGVTLASHHRWSGSAS